MVVSTPITILETIITKPSNKQHNKAFKSDSQRLAVSLRSSIAKRRSHLNAALCLITKSQWFMIVLCSLGL
ncbi:hypothetical protein D7151_18440 [Vibrio cholerae]|nr:hypothetical protein [Vibrio cholerae]